jgi:hypothetical protein
MSQCVAKTKTGVRCSRIVKDGGNLCFQHKGQAQPTPKAQPAPNPQDSYGKKAPKLRKAECLNDATKYVWVVGKGCFEKLQTPPAAPAPADKPSTPAQPPVIKTVCTERTPIDNRESPFVKNLDCRDLPLEQVRFILGPCVFYEFEIGNRRIYMFGEVHAFVSRHLDKILSDRVDRYNSLSFQGFVHSLVTQNPTKTYDLMFENSYFDRILPNSNTTISSVFNQITDEFLNCIDPKKRPLCRYKNLRTHYVDFRKFFPKWSFVRGTLPPKEIQQAINTFLTTPGKVLKQINAIKDDKIRNAIIKFFRDFVTLTPADAGLAGLAIMDIYAMSRILRDFDSKKTNGVSSFKGTAQNVIYYAGAAHTMTFVRFLTDYLKLKPKAVRGEFKEFPRKKLSCQSFVDMGDVTKTMV